MPRQTLPAHFLVALPLLLISCSSPGSGPDGASATGPGGRGGGASGPQTLLVSSPSCDLLLSGGRVVDGTGAPWFRADVCVTGDRIAAIGYLPAATARRRIDASGLVVAPGFIDMMGQSEYNVLVDNRAASKITQGITTEVTGEGSSIAPLNARMIADAKATTDYYGVTPNFTTLEGYFREFTRRGAAINLATFVGAGGVRNLVIGKDNRPATAAELAAMEAAVAQAMEQGALGVSTSLLYVPDRFASTEEIIALARVAARYGGSYITHQRDEGDDGNGGLDRSLDEVFRVAREARIPAEVYHLKVSGKSSWGRMAAILQRFESARAEGLDVSADQYPWTASSNNLDASLPAWVLEGGTDKMVARLKDPAARARIRADFLKAPENADWPEGAARNLITSVLNPELKSYEGRTLQEIARAEKKDPLDLLMDIVVADKGNTSRVSFSMSEDDVRVALKDRLVSFCTDSPAMAEDGIFSKEKSHPRAWGSAPRILGTYVREVKLLPLEEAIRKMTSLPAARMHLNDRGILRPGMAADLVAFDPLTVRERSTFTDPLHYSKGIPYVAVNGQLVVDGGKITAARPGRILRGPGFMNPTATR
jgi:N-acyl-D-amino-acid deacylase